MHIDYTVINVHITYTLHTLINRKYGIRDKRGDKK